MPPPDVRRGGPEATSADIGSATDRTSSDIDSNATTGLDLATEADEQIRDTHIVYGFLSDRVGRLSRPSVTAWAERLSADDLADLDRTLRQLKPLRHALAAKLGKR
jgi:hypothetical protein